MANPPGLGAAALAKLELGELTPDNSLRMVAESHAHLQEIRGLLGA